MKYKKLIEITDQEVIQLWKDIYDVNEVTAIERDKENNLINVSFITTWGEGTEDDPYEDIEDTVTMYSDSFDEPDFSQNGNEQYQYKKFMIARGYSQYWKDNKYVIND